MTRWNYKLTLKKYFHQDDNDPEKIRISGHQISQAIKQWSSIERFPELQDVAEEIDEICEEIDDRFILSCINDRLDELYNYADHYRIWID